MRNMIIASTSTLHGESHLEYLLPIVKDRLREVDCNEILFVPYARPSGISHEAYTEIIKNIFNAIDVAVIGLDESIDKIAEIERAKAIYVGGGNTFVLVKKIQELSLISALRKRIYEGAFYLGTSAGSNICGLTMGTTNDMPVVLPSTLKTMGAIGYNINAHYLDPDRSSQHMGETRETRIKEFHVYNHIPVVGLREGSFIDVLGKDEALKGKLHARIFRKDEDPIEVPPEYNFNKLSNHIL